MVVIIIMTRMAYGWPHHMLAWPIFGHLALASFSPMTITWLTTQSAKSDRSPLGEIYWHRQRCIHFTLYALYSLALSIAQERHREKKGHHPHCYYLLEMCGGCNAQPGSAIKAMLAGNVHGRPNSNFLEMETCNVEKSIELARAIFCTKLLVVVIAISSARCMYSSISIRSIRT